MQLELGVYYLECRPENPLQSSQQSVSLGRSATVNVVAGSDEAIGLSLDIGSGSGSREGSPRWNSLGGLKIPARISEAPGRVEERFRHG